MVEKETSDELAEHGMSNMEEVPEIHLAATPGGSNTLNLPPLNQMSIIISVLSQGIGK